MKLVGELVTVGELVIVGELVTVDIENQRSAGCRLRSTIVSMLGMKVYTTLTRENTTASCRRGGRGGGQA